jgi:hypothetical protein
MGSTVKKVASIALPIAAMAIPGVNVIAAGAIGGALGGVISGGGLKGALIGGIGGALSGGIVKAGGFGNFFGGLGGAGSAVTQSGGAMAGIMGRAGTGAATSLGLAGGTMGSTATAARLAANAATRTGITGVTSPQSFMSSQLASAGSYRPQLSSLSGGAPTSVGQGVVAGTTGGVGQPRQLQLKSNQLLPSGKTGLGFDRESLKEMITAGYSGYQDDAQQQQLDALRENLSQYRGEYAGHYASEAKKHQDKLARGELPETYNAALDREAQRLSRLLTAQGHNPAESGFGRDEFKRGLMDLESKFISNERDYWRAVGGGADTMTAQIGLLESNLAQSNVGNRGTSQALDTIMDKIL